MTSAQTDRLLSFIAIASLLAVGIALVSQHFFDMPPCAYCVFQRLLFLAVAASSILALLLRKVRLGQMLFTLLAIVFSIGGVAAAFYQHTVASQMLSCSQTFADRFMTKSGLDEALPAVFGIYASCADAVVEVLGLKYELWSLALFVILGATALVALVRQARAPARLFS